MNGQKNKHTDFEEFKVSVNMKLASLWTSFMFLYIYVDYFHLYMPGALSDMLAGKVFVFDVSQGFLLITLISVSIPAWMIFLSVALPAKVNRLINMIVAVLFIPYSLFNLAGEAWVHMILGAALEVAMLLLVIYYAWNWPRNSI